MQISARITPNKSKVASIGLVLNRAKWKPAGRAVEVSLKIAGVHWWYNSRSHAAELTAGYYNTEAHDGYAGILELCAQHGLVATLTCVEMCDGQHPPEALCGPEGLLRQVLLLIPVALVLSSPQLGSCVPSIASWQLCLV